MPLLARSSGAFDRAVAPNITKITAAEAVRRTEVEKLVKRLVHDAGMEKSA